MPEIDLSRARELTNKARELAAVKLETDGRAAFEAKVTPIVQNAVGNLQERIDKAATSGESTLVVYSHLFGYNMWGPKASTPEIDEAYRRIETHLKTGNVRYEVAREEPGGTHPGRESLIVKW